MPSIAGDNSLSHGEVKERDKESTPVWPQNTRKQHSHGSVRAPVPYHKKFPLVEDKSASPGEVRSNTQSDVPGRALKKRADLSVSFAHSEGEVHPTIRQETGKHEKKAEQPPPELSTTASPGELRINLSTANKTRDGIDVIRISNSSPNSRSSRKDVSLTQKITPHPVPNLSPTQPPATSNRVRVRAEMGPARLVTVAETPATPDNREQATEGSKEHEISEATTSTKSPQLKVLTVVPSPAAPDLSSDGTRPPGLESPLHTSSSSSDILLNTSLAEHSTAAQPSKTGQPSEQQNSPEKQDTSSPPLGLELHSFWDTKPPNLPTTRYGRVVQESKTLAPPSFPDVLQTEQGKENRTPLPSNAPDTHAATAGDIITRPNSDDVIPAAGNRLVSNVSPTKLQLNISVPFTTAMKDNESPITSPVPSPTYSSDFDFSSISQPTFD